jgi:uncharacterized membrane protein YdcZ (DUF606 family)
MTHTDRREDVTVHDGPGRARPLVYAGVLLAVFVTTVIVLAVQAGTDAAMLTTLFAIVIAGTACGLWGTAMAVRDTDAHLPAAVERHLVEHPSRPAP